jgi:hypothetical protein
VTGLVFAAFAAVVLAGFALYVYRRRELPISGRGRLAALRVATLVGVVLLLANPIIPTGGSAGPPDRWILVDGSVSMAVAGPSGVSAWDRAHTEAGSSIADLPLAVFGDATPSPQGESLPTVADGLQSRLEPTLRRVAEAGAREVSIFSDLRLSDAPEVQALIDALDLDVRFVDVGEPVRTAGIARLNAPETGRAGEVVEVRVDVFGTPPTEGETVIVEVLRDQEVVEERSVRLPGAGRTVSVSLDGVLPDSAGAVRWQARVRLEGDAFGGDDVRSAFTQVDPLEGLVVLVSMTPDWEPRFLLPVLGRVTGLPTRGWFRVGADDFLPMDGSGGLLDGAALARVAQDARLVVVHGLSGDAPPWVVRAQNEARRAIVFAADQAGAQLAGVATEPTQSGEWYADAAAGPLSAAFAGVSWADLPPLSAPLPPDSAAGAGLNLERAGGARAAALSLQDRDERRRAVVLAQGFWRWGFRPGVGADAYDRLWSGVAGWLLGLEDSRGGGGLGPADPVVPADRPIAWWAPVAASGSLEIRTGTAATEARLDTVPVGADGRATLPPLAVGSWNWSARILAPDSLAERERVWTGRIEAESHTDEFRWPRDTTLLTAGAATPTSRRAASGRPLRTSPWPYLLLLVLLSAEWIFRRRSGLR